MKFERFGLGILKGLVVTIKNLLRPPITVQYPEEKLVPSRRIRGNEFVWYCKRCTGCATCVKACPQGNITLVTQRGDNQYVVDRFEIDTGRCMFCGLCVESCPYEALYLGRGYERAAYRRGQLVQSKEEMEESDKRRPSGYARPEVEKKLPKQTLLLAPEKEGGQKLPWLPLRKRRRK